MVLIDHENIDCSLGRIIGPNNLNQETRPQWAALQDFALGRSSHDNVNVMSFLQYAPSVKGFAKYLQGTAGFYVVLLEPEIDAEGFRRPVVDEAIYKWIEHCLSTNNDIIVVSNDGGYADLLMQAKDNNPDRMVSVVGFKSDMSMEYFNNGINVYDLETDVGAFTYELENRLVPTKVDDYHI